MIRAVIFDMDGVLTDSERLGDEPLIIAGQKQGYRFTHENIPSCKGMTFAAAAPIFEKAFPGIDALRLGDDFDHAMCDLARAGGVPLMKGVREILDALDERRMPRAVASSSRRFVIDTYLGAHGIERRFDALISGELCKRSKPDPEVFLLAAQRLNTEPKDCLVIEDSANGVRAGRAAGMTVCMVPDQIPYTDALKAYCDYVKNDLLEVIPLL